ncbi:MAG: DUF2089 family protein [candidate division WOR-3 bacterium]|nr:DUF2089 family protein [candidate division WOR-3 bacterium]
MKIRKIDGLCPSCGRTMIVKKVQCPDCEIEITGNMEIGAESASGIFTDDEWGFIREFLICEGNLKCLGEKLGKSYPTIKNKLKEIKNKLPGGEYSPSRIDSLLDELESGELSAADIIKQIKGGK